MKKTIISSFFALAVLFALPVAAQNDASTGATKTEQTSKDGKKEKKDRKEGKEHRQHMKRSNAFEGIDLTDTQKESLKALRPQRPERPQTGERKDSLARGERPNFKKIKADYVNNVKSILTPEQYVIFLENIVINDAMIPGASRDVNNKVGHQDKNSKKFDKERGHKREHSPRKK